MIPEASRELTPITLPESGEPDAVEDSPVDDEEAVIDSSELDEPGEAELEEAQADPLEGLEFIEEPVKPETLNSRVDATPLMDLETAIEQIPSELRKEMEDLLRAEFREVIRWKAGKK